MDDKPSLDQLPEHVTQVESLLADARSLLEGLSAPESLAESMETVFKQSQQHEIDLQALHEVFLAWDELEIPSVEKSEVVRALGLIKRAKLVNQNALRIGKQSLGIPDPEREQAELQMQLQAMGVIFADRE